VAELVSSVARETESSDESLARAISTDKRRGAMCSLVDKSPTSGQLLISVRLIGGNACSINMHSRGKSAREEERISNVLHYERSDHYRHVD